MKFEKLMHSALIIFTLLLTLCHGSNGCPPGQVEVRSDHSGSMYIICIGEFIPKDVGYSTAVLQLTAGAKIVYVESGTPVANYSYMVRIQNSHCVNEEKPVDIATLLSGYKIGQRMPSPCGSHYTATLIVLLKSQYNSTVEVLEGPVADFHTLETLAVKPRPTWSSILVEVPGEAVDDFPGTLYFNMSDFGNPELPHPVYGADRIALPSPQTMNITNLKPGTNYHIDWKIVRDGSPLMAFEGTTVVKTRCSCSPTFADAPVLHMGMNNDADAVTQRYGFVYFSFYGYSVCGDAYKFTRQKLLDNGGYSTPESFVPDYMFHHSQSCPTFYQPGKDTSDDLFQSKLEVGHKYRYTITATGDDYESEPTYLEHTIVWESSIAGFVGLAPQYGNMPVDSVHVEWILKDLQGETVSQGTTMTSSNGKFKIDLAIDNHTFTNDGNYPVYLKFSKTTSVDETYSIEHQFTCNNGNVNCVSEYAVVYLEHLDFDTSFTVVDQTSVPVSGMVYMANTFEDDSGKRWGDKGCPVGGVQMCLIDKVPGPRYNQQFVCVNTNEDGSYELPATVGSLVAVNATFHNHTFHYNPTGETLDMNHGFLIKPGTSYSQNDFEDLTTTQLKITVAGSYCNFTLGVSRVRYSVHGCPWGGSTKQLENFQQIFLVPAHNLEFKVIDINGRPDITFDNFIDKDLTLAMEWNQTRHMNEEAEERSNLEENNLTGSDHDDIPEVRFDYEGTAILETVFEDNIIGKCTQVNIKGSKKIASPVVLPFQTPMKATIFVTRKISNEQTCDIANPSAKLQIHNSLGLMAGDSSDEKYKQLLENSYPNNVMQLLQVCNNNCTMDIIHDLNPETGKLSNARVEFTFMTGRPNNQDEYTKTFEVSTIESSPVSLRIEAVVVGQYKLADGQSVGLPTYEPILILRDPPGGGSSAFYENVETTIRVKNIGYEEYSGLDSNVKMLFGAKLAGSMCEGAFVEACESVYDSKLIAGTDIKVTEKHLDTIKQFMNSGGFTTTWSYSTSSNPLVAGAASDVFVVPNLDVVYSTTDIVKWNSSQCLVSKETQTTFSLQNPENVPALAFVTEYEIRKVEIPLLNEIIASLHQDLDNCQDDVCRTKCNEKIASAEDGITGWEEALKLNDHIKDSIKNSTVAIRPHEWFDKVANESFSSTYSAKYQYKDDTTISLDGMSHNSRLVSQTLSKNAKVRAHYANDDAATDMTTMNTIKFAGGGAAMTYQLNQEKIRESVSSLGGYDDNSYTESVIAGAFVHDGAYGGVALDQEGTVGGLSISSVSHMRSDHSGASTNIGFSLSDSDIGDIFDVDVYIDRRFGTFVFQTRGGQSMCPTESGTAPRVESHLEIKRRPSTIVLENEPMIFEVSLTNTGSYPSSFELNLDMRGGVAQGLDITGVPASFERINPRETVNTMVIISRGPELHDYDPITLIAEAGCEAGLSAQLDAIGGTANSTKQLDNLNGRLVFVQPCPRVSLGGQIDVDQNFAVTTIRNTDQTVKLVVQNPSYLWMPLYNATMHESTRLQKVSLMYRRKGSIDWEYGQYKDESGKMIDIDFAAQGLENSYGFVSVDWDVAGLYDGEYDMYVTSVCEPIGGAPDDFKWFRTSILPGVIDRQEPQLFGSPMPFANLPVRQAIQVEFEEYIDCSIPFLFDVNITVGSGPSLYKDSLLIVCESRTIWIKLNEAHISLDDSVGQPLIMELSNVVDKNGNSMKKKVTYHANIVDSAGYQLDDRKSVQQPHLR